MATTAKYLLSSKGKNLLVYDDCIFRRKSKLGGRSYWICSYDKGYRCKARLCVLDNSNPPKILTKSGNHNHEREHGRVEAREMVNTLKQQAVESNDTIDRIYSSCVNVGGLSEGGLVAMSNKAAVKAAMRRARIRSSQNNGELDAELNRPRMSRDRCLSDPTSEFSLTWTKRAEIANVEIASRRNKRKGIPRKLIYQTEQGVDDDSDDISIEDHILDNHHY